ncbi:MAG: ATP-binding protein [Eubacterium sp.]|nr:ATP-binding protein [Eubacterium sp.]
MQLEEINAVEESLLRCAPAVRVRSQGAGLEQEKTMDFRTTSDQEKIAWKERMHRLRVLYRGIPGGYRDEEEAEQAAGALREEQKNLAEQMQPGFSEPVPAEWKQFYERSRDPFIGRAAELSAISEAFRSGKGPVILCGLGGIGKTSVAEEYLRIHQNEYDRVIALTYPGSLEQLIGDDYLLPVKGFRYERTRYKTRSRYVRRKLQEIARIFRRENTLLVIDDWNRQEKGRQADLFGLPCDLLITTRLHAEVWNGGTCIITGAFRTQDEWKQFYEVYGNGIAEQTAEQYRIRTGGHTLRMIMCFREKQGQQDAAEGSAFHLQDDVASTRGAAHRDIFKDLLMRIPLKQTEKQVMREMSVLPVQGISWERYCAVSDVSGRTVRGLADKSLLQVRYDTDQQPERLSVHPVIAEAARLVFRPNAVNCRTLIKGYGEITKDAWIRSFRENQKEVPYVMALLHAFPEPEAWMAESFDRLLILLMMQEYAEEVIAGYKKLYTIVSCKYGPEHQLTAQMQLRVAAAYFNSQDYASSVPWYQMAYDTLKRCSPYDARWSHLMAEAAGKQSRVCRGRKEYSQALKYIEEALKYEEQAVLAAEKKRCSRTAEKIADLPEMEAYLTYYFWLLDLGKIHMRTGEPASAEKCLETVLEYLKKDKRAARYFTETFTRTELDKYRLELLVKEKRFPEAEMLVQNMIDYAVAQRGETHSYTMGILLRRADLRAAEGEKQKAASEYRTLLRMLHTAHPYWTEQVRRVERRITALEEP